MFYLFRKKTPLEKLQGRYKKTIAEWHKISSTNRAESDAKYEEAQQILGQINRLSS